MAEELEEDSGEDSNDEGLESESEGHASSNDEEDFGPEDGEGVFGDVEDEEGYAPL